MTDSILRNLSTIFDKLAMQRTAGQGRIQYFRIGGTGRAPHAPKGWGLGGMFPSTDLKKKFRPWNGCILRTFWHD